MLINTTEHDIVVYDTKKENVIYTFKKSDIKIRLDIEPQVFVQNIKINSSIDIPVYTAQKFTRLNVSGQLDMKQNYIVSQMVLDFVSKTDSALERIFYCPDTNEGAVRKDGKIIGTTRFLK